MTSLKPVDIQCRCNLCFQIFLTCECGTHGHGEPTASTQKHCIFSSQIQCDFNSSLQGSLGCWSPLKPGEVPPVPRSTCPEDNASTGHHRARRPSTRPADYVQDSHSTIAQNTFLASSSKRFVHLQFLTATGSDCCNLESIPPQSLLPPERPKTHVRGQSGVTQ